MADSLSAKIFEGGALTDWVSVLDIDAELLTDCVAVLDVDAELLTEVDGIDSNVLDKDCVIETTLLRVCLKVLDLVKSGVTETKLLGV